MAPVTVTLDAQDWQRLQSAAYAHAADLDANGSPLTSELLAATATRLGDALDAAGGAS